MEYLSTITDTLLLFLSPFNHAYLPNSVLKGLAAFFIIGAAAKGSIELSNSNLPKEQTAAINMVLWIGLLGLINISGKDDGVGIINIIFIIVAAIVRFCEGLGIIKGLNFENDFFSRVAFVLTIIYTLIVFELSNFFSLPLFFQLMGIVHIGMLFITLSGIGRLIPTIGFENELQAKSAYAVFIIAFFIVQFLNIKSLSSPKEADLFLYYLYVLAFPLGVIIMFSQNFEKRFNK